jgi:predicted Rossmann fold flavoprotein
MHNHDVLILGGGASALMCATHLDKNLSIAIVESNNKIAKKLKISGGGKCNVTNVNVSADNYDGDMEIISYALDTFSKNDLLNFLSENGINDLEIRKNRYYFFKNSADEIIDIFKKHTKKVKFYMGTKVLDASKKDDLFEVKTDKGILKSKKLVVASGGRSFSTLGASDIGLKIAKSFNIKTKEFTPALVGLTLQPEQFWMKDLSGLSCYVHIKVGYKTLKEEMLFAHKGISGPAVLSASLYWQKGDISIDFLPNKNIELLIKDTNKKLSSAIPLPKRLSKAILEAIGVHDKECKKLDSKDIQRLNAIHNYTFAPAGNFGFTKAEVSRGGVDTNELNHYTMESLDVEGLYFIGEVVDVTGELGGYNFQWAFSSAVVCANSIYF